jgi:NAD(P)-dependent dehydrogenase (short-subunit alcohol dehydrogenase family)
MTAPVSSPIDLAGRTAVVTGAAGGIGRATCEALARHGADVVATDVDEDHLDQAVEAVESHGGECETVGCDISDPDDVAALREAAFAFADSVEIVANVAGVVHRNDFSEMTLEQWNRVIGINLTGTFLVTQAFYDHMVERGYGKVVCVSSVSGRVGGVISDAGYASSKAGIHGLVRWLGKNAAPDGVYVNAVAPGPIVTPMTEGEDYRPDMAPLNRLGEPEDIAEGVLYLASDMSNYVTGTVLDVNGGMRMN